MVMLPRLLVVVAVVQPSLVLLLLPPLVTMLVVAGVGCLVLWRDAGRQGDGAPEPELSNPFSLKEAVRLGLVFAVVRFVVAAAHEQFADAGLYASSTIAGLTDVDAIAISVARMQSTSAIPEGVAMTAIVLAAVTNSLSKAGIALVIGGRRLGLAVAAVLVPVAVAGLVVAYLAR